MHLIWDGVTEFNTIDERLKKTVDLAPHHFPPTGGRAPRAVAVVIHGLNVRPDRLQPIVEVLAGSGAHVLRLTLQGHEPGDPAIRTATSAGWLADVACAARAARELAAQPGLPRLLVAQSLGALLEVVRAQDPAEPAFDRRVLLQPALRLRWRAQLLRAWPFPVPSAAHPDYRVHRALPTSAYRALFQSLAALRAPSDRERATATLVCADPRDELVSYRGLREMLEKQHLAAWRLFPMDNRGSALRPRYHHCAVDPASMGGSQWEAFSRELIGFFSLG
jgi:alpha-beta hydrolase superfamily lysophospholipase